MTSKRGKETLFTVLGVTAGVAAGVWLWTRQQRFAPDPVGERLSGPVGTGGEVADALRRDPELSRRPVEVDTISEGVVELAGRVANRAEAERAVRVAQGTPGVSTVVNRLVIEDEERHLSESRRRRADGAPELTEKHHYGMGVGMGRRRQSAATDPDRPSDKQKILERELEVGNIEDAPESGPDPISGDEAVETSAVKPGDESAIREAGLDPSPRPTSTPKRSVDAAQVGETGGGPEPEDTPDRS